MIAIYVKSKYCVSCLAPLSVECAAPAVELYNPLLAASHYCVKETVSQKLNSNQSLETFTCKNVIKILCVSISLTTSKTTSCRIFVVDMGG